MSDMPDVTIPVEGEAGTKKPSEVTLEELSQKILDKILSDYGLTAQDILDNHNPSKRPNYMKRAANPEAVRMPTPDQEADLMAERVGLNTKGRGHLAIMELIDKQQEYRKNYENYMIIRQSPKWLLFVAKTLIFFKNLFTFKRSR